MRGSLPHLAPSLILAATIAIGFDASVRAQDVKVEQDLMALYPRERWTMLSHLLIWHGRRVCEARTPRCEACTVSSLCPSSRV